MNKCIFRLSTTKKKVFFAPLFLMVLLSPNVWAEEFFLARDGSPLMPIVLPESPSRGELFAAQELKDHLNQVLGADFSVISEDKENLSSAIYVGRTHFARNLDFPLQREAFFLGGKDGNILILGGDDFGILYGVYALLEKIGVKWLVPGDLGTVIPKKSQINIDLKPKVYKPAFQLRGVEWGLWGLRNGNNYLNDPDVPLSAVMIPAGKIHTMDYWLPPEKYYPAASDFYALVEGSRNPFRFIQRKTATWKVDPENQKVSEEIAKNICSDTKKYPGAEFFLVAPMDGENWNESANTLVLTSRGRIRRWGRYSSSYYMLYSNIAQMVRRCAPDVKIVGLAYHYYTLPPEPVPSKASPNLGIMVARYTPFDMARPLNDPRSSGSALFASCLRDWRKVVGDNLYVFDYLWKVNWLELPWPVSHTIGTEIPLFKEFGVSGLLSQNNLKENGWSIGLQFYLASKLLWDPSRNPEEIKSEWINGLFQEAAAPMHEYYNVLEHAMASQINISGDAVKNAEKVFSVAVLARLEKSLKEASALAHDPITLQRLSKVKKSLRYTQEVVSILRIKGKDLAKAEDKLQNLQTEFSSHPEDWQGVISGAIRQKGRLGKRLLQRN